MRRLKLTMLYPDENDSPVKKTITVPIPKDKEEDVFDFEGRMNSGNPVLEFSLAIISSNVEVYTWEYGDVDITEMNKKAAGVDEGQLVMTCPSLPTDVEEIMVFGPPTMEDFVKNGRFKEIFKEVRDSYESFYWTGAGESFELIVYFKDGTVKTYR